MSLSYPSSPASSTSLENIYQLPFNTPSKDGVCSSYSKFKMPLTCICQVHWSEIKVTMCWWVASRYDSHNNSSSPNPTINHKLQSSNIVAPNALSSASVMPKNVGYSDGGCWVQFTTVFPAHSITGKFLIAFCEFVIRSWISSTTYNPFDTLQIWQDTGWSLQEGIHGPGRPWVWWTWWTSKAINITCRFGFQPPSGRWEGVRTLRRGL